MGLGTPAQPLSSLRPLTGLPSSPFPQVAERVLQQDHRLQGSELNLVPHYDVLEPEELAADASGGDHSAELGPGATEHAFLEAGEPARALEDVGTVTLGSKEAPGQSGAPLRTEPIRSLGQAMGSSDQEGLESLGLPGSSGQAEPVSSRPAESPGPVGSVENALGPPEQVGSGSLEPGAPLEQERLVEMVLSMEPGTMRYMQLYYEDLLAGLGDVALFPLEESDMTGFRVSDPLAPSPPGSSRDLSGALNLRAAPSPLTSCSSVEPWPRARQRRSFCRVCWAASATTC